MFDLCPSDLRSSILDCAGGPSSFNAEMRHLGHAVVSCDPIYGFSPAHIAKRIEETQEAILDGVTQSRNNFVWQEIPSPEHLLKLRLDTMKRFLEDLPIGVSEARYVVGELPALPFAEGEFDLGLCSHFLFTYSNLLSLEFHLASLCELCRVAREVRVFPLVGQFGTGRCNYVSEVLRQLEAEGYQCEAVRVPYEFQKNGNEMLRICRDTAPRTTENR